MPTNPGVGPARYRIPAERVPEFLDYCDELLGTSINSWDAKLAASA